jgi:hypothetical protein
MTIVTAMITRTAVALCLVATMLSFAMGDESPRLCKIVVTEKGTGWPVPLVELRTTSQVRFVTDNAGVIAFDLPELMGQETWFDVQGHGYEMTADGFGYRGVRLVPQRGQTLKVEVVRKIIARRIGRLTGSGLYAESQKLGQETEWNDARLVGCDSVQTAIHGEKLYWAWGDTTVAKHPLGIFDTTAATTRLRPLKSFEPPLKLSFDYLTDPQGNPRGGSYIKVKPPLEAYECGLCVFDEARSRFEPLRTVWTKSAATPKQPEVPDGHATLWTDEHRQRWILFGNPLPKLRCPATFEAWQDPEQWQVLDAQKSIPSMTDGTPVVPHTGSIAWNEFRGRWVTVFMEGFGKPSVFGELWYAEAPSPAGPWGPAIKVLSHNNYTFYNPRLHPELTPSDSPILMFEGTYTQQFADHPQPTPRYDYNQILYRLDLDAPELAGARK